MRGKKVWVDFVGMLFLVFSLLLSMPDIIHAQAYIPPSETVETSQLPLTGSISGHVYQADGVTPISGANVLAHSLNQGFFMGSGPSGVDGSYSIIGLPTDEYWVAAHVEGYIAEYFENAYSHTLATSISVTAPDNVPNIDFTLEIGGSISGHVYQNDGITPIAGASVSAIPLGKNSGGGAVTAADGSHP